MSVVNNSIYLNFQSLQNSKEFNIKFLQDYLNRKDKSQISGRMHRHYYCSLRDSSVRNPFSVTRDGFSFLSNPFENAISMNVKETQTVKMKPDSRICFLDILPCCLHGEESSVLFQVRTYPVLHATCLSITVPQVQSVIVSTFDVLPHPHTAFSYR